MSTESANTIVAMWRGLLITASTILLLSVTVAGLFAFDRNAYDGRVARNVTAAGIDLSGLTTAEAEETLGQFEARVLAPLAIDVDSEEVLLNPVDMGVQVDTTAVVKQAMAVGRRGTLLDEFADWVFSWSRTVELSVGVAYDFDAVRATLDGLEATVVDRPPFQGAIELRGHSVVPLPPVEGATLEFDTAAALVSGALQSTRRVDIRLPLVPPPTLLTADQVTAAAMVANDLIDAEVVVRDPRGLGDAVVSASILRAALRSELVVKSPADIRVWLDSEPIEARLAGSTDQFETAPVDADFRFDEETFAFSIVPSVDGTTLDVRAAARRVIDAALDGDKVVMAPITTGELPQYSTERLEAMSMTKVSEFTTRHSCCEARVTNIHLMADAVDGAIVWPGETFSINERVGQRTTAKGYRRAGAIISGEVSCCDSAINIGGGTSQFGTTFYNAVFFSCYEDVEHQPHSIYFSRYPRGREATLGYPKPDVIFRNDTSTPVWIDTSYTSSSITVTFYGDSEGRVCTEEVKGRNPITVTRVVTYPDGRVERQPFTWTYRSFA